MTTEEIAEARRRGGLLADARSVTLEEGYALAEEVAARLGEVVGWKVGATSAGAQAFLQVAEPIYGRVFAGGVMASGAVAAPGERAAEAEPEIVFELTRDPDPADPAAAIGRALVGLEVVRPSRDDAFALGAGFIVADNAAHVGLVLGPELPPGALNEPAGLRVALERNGEAAGKGDAAAVLGDPVQALAWLVRKRAGTERPVRAGDLVATGAMCRAAPLAIGDRVVADFGRWGRVEAAREVMGRPGE
jgi:2-keto-4-pentenoate hydratase